MSSQSQIKIGALLSYVAIVVNIITGLFYTPWMISVIGREDFGLYTLAMSVISLFVFDFGLSSAVTRFISKYLAKGEVEKANRFLGILYKLYLGIDFLLLCILFILFFFIPQIYKELTLDEIEKFKVVYVIAAIYSVVSFPLIPVNGVLTASEKFIQLKLCDLLHKIIIVTTMSICLLLGCGLYALVLVNAIAGGIVIFMKLFCIKKYTKLRINWHFFDKNELRVIAGFSGWVTIKSLSQRCIMNIAPSILGIMSGSAEIAILGIAITIEGYSYTFASALNGMFLPKVSRDLANNIDIVPLMVKVGRIQIVIIGLIVSAFILFGRKFVFLWIGESFLNSYWCAMLMILPSFFHLPQEIAHQAVYALNKVKLEAYVFVIMAAINVALAVVLTPNLGAIGIGISVCFSYLIRTIGMDYIYYKKMNIDIFLFFIKSFVPMILPLVILFPVGILINKYFLTGWFSLCIQIFIYTFCYCVTIYLFYLNTFEKQLIISPIRKLFKI